MKSTEVFLLNSFTGVKTGGNGAGLVLNLDYSEKEMIEIAKQVGLCETAFMEKINNNEYKIRYFTPAGEVDLCGHATIAAFSYLKNENLIKNGKYKLNTKAGIIDIIVNDIITMSQNLPVYDEIINKDEILKCFKNIKKSDLIENMPIQVVSTGLRDIIVPIKNLQTLLNLEADFNEIKKLSKKYNTIGAHLFSLETLNNSTAHTRNFAPLYDIPEESATGTSNGALSCYLFKYFNSKNIDFNNMIFEQGYSMKKPSEISAKLDIQNKQINGVYVGGNAILIGSLNV